MERSHPTDRLVGQYREASGQESDIFLGDGEFVNSSLNKIHFVLWLTGDVLNLFNEEDITQILQSTRKTAIQNHKIYKFIRRIIYNDCCQKRQFINDRTVCLPPPVHRIIVWKRNRITFRIKMIKVNVFDQLGHFYKFSEASSLNQNAIKSIQFPILNGLRKWSYKTLISVCQSA